jgi:hypothetical protein
MRDVPVHFNGSPAGRDQTRWALDPAQLPHKALGVDIALECTGPFTEGKVLPGVAALEGQVQSDGR